MVSVCTVPAKEGRSCERYGGYKTINGIPLFQKGRCLKGDISLSGNIKEILDCISWKMQVYS